MDVSLHPEIITDINDKSAQLLIYIIHQSSKSDHSKSSILCWMISWGNTLR
ncbi:hypothetical protein M2273_004316 [Mucilaginibacter lappiensis]|jgi:hypothetical protein